MKSDSAVNIPIENSFFYHTNLEANEIYLKLGNEDREVFGAMTLLKTNYNNSLYYTVKLVGTNYKNLKKGVVRSLYERAVELNFKLISDSAHTTFGSKDLWLKFPIYFPQKVIYTLDIETFYKRQLANQIESRVWGKEEDEDFDILEKEDKIYLIEELYNSNVISSQQKEFFIKNLDNLSDRKNIRLTLE